MERKLSRHALLMAVLTVIPFYSSAQEKPFAMPLVPAADWRQVDSHALPLAAVSQYGGDPTVDKEYGVKTLELRTYQLGKTRTAVVVERAPDATSAYALFTFYTTPAMSPPKDVQLAYGDSTQAIMARGTNFIRFWYGSGATASASDEVALLTFVGGSKPSASALQTLPTFMPPKGLVPGSEKYLLGLEAAKRVLPSFRADLIGFDQGAEVQLGQYTSAKGASTLMSISYPTPQIARNRFGSLTDLLELNKDRGENSVFGKRHGSYVFLVLNAENEANASALIDQFQVTQGVSWDHPYVTERTFTMQLVRMIFSIVLLTAMLVGACVVAGVAFFLSKRIARKYFPNSQWGNADADQLIRLNL